MYSDITQFLDKEFTFTKHIKESKYIQSCNKDRINTQVRYKSLIECIIGENDPMIQVIPNKQKLISIKQKIIELCSLLFENQEEYYYKYKFNEKIMKPKLISQALQSNYLSAIYYLNEYYQTHFVIIINNKYYPTSSKSYPKQYILHNQDNNQMISINSKVTFEDILPPLIKNDLSIKSYIYIYNVDLKPIQQYKLGDCIELAKQYNLSLYTNNNKKKIKKELYKDIYIYLVNH